MMNIPTKLTYEEAKEIVNHNGELIFYESKLIVNGFNVSIFNYRLAQYNNFIKPLPNSNINAFEMRGLTFVFNEDGSVYKRFLMLSKFFNINQVPDSLYDKVKDYNIKNVMNKEDGSLIGFIDLPDGSIVSRTKMSFESEQAIRAGEIFKNNKYINEFVKWSIDNNINLFFEYVSHSNRIVLDYKDTDLILIKARDNDSGDMIDINTFDVKNITLCEYESFNNLDDIIELSKSLKDKEGWVIEFDNNYMIKIKTKWYFDAHHINFNVVSRENDIIRLILNEEIDDVISQIDKSHIEKFKLIDDISNIIDNAFKYEITEIEKVLEYYNGDIKIFALNLKGDERIHLCFKIINGEDIYDVLKKLFLKQTTHLQQARKWLKKYKLIE